MEPILLAYLGIALSLIHIYFEESVELELGMTNLHNLVQHKLLTRKKMCIRDRYTDEGR